MFIKEAVRCAVCGHLLMNKVAELPMEIPSTGAIVYNITAEIKCDKCKSIACYTMMPKKPLDIL